MSERRESCVCECAQQWSAGERTCRKPGLGRPDPADPSRRTLVAATRSQAGRIRTAHGSIERGHSSVSTERIVDRAVSVCVRAGLTGECVEVRRGGGLQWRCVLLVLRERIDGDVAQPVDDEQKHARRQRLHRLPTAAGWLAGGLAGLAVRLCRLRSTV